MKKTRILAALSLCLLSGGSQAATWNTAPWGFDTSASPNTIALHVGNSWLPIFTMTAGVPNIWRKEYQGSGANATATAFSASNQAVYIAGTLTGTGQAPFGLYSIADTATNTTAGFTPGLWIAHNVGSGAGEGSRVALQPILTINNALPCSSGGAFCFHISTFPQTYVNANLGGTSGAGNSRGDVYGVGGLAQLGGSATYIHGLSNEMNVAAQTGSSVDYKSILTIISVNSDAVKGSLYDAMLGFTADNTTTAKWSYGVAFGRGDSTWPFNTSSTLIGSVAAGTGARVANYGVDLSGVTFSTCSYKSAGFCIDPLGSFNDQSTQTANLPTYYYPTYYGSNGTGIVHRMNRLLVGDASTKTGGVGVGATPLPWVESYFPLMTVSSVSSGAPNGQIAVSGYANTSPYRTIFGVPTLGAQGGTWVAVNDDTGACVVSGITYCPTAVADVGLAVREAGVNSGITVGAQFDVSNKGTVVNVSPNSGIGSGATVALDLTPGTAPSLANNASAAVYVGGTTKAFRKGIVFQASSLDTSVGSGGGGLAMDLPVGASIRWMDAGGGVVGEIDAGASLMNLRANVYSTQTIAAATTITAGTFAKVTPTTFATGLAGSSTCSDKGRIWAVTDGAAALAWGANISGGGTAYYTINCNGSNWTVMGK